MSIVSVTHTESAATMGRGDQWPMSALSNGSHLTVVNDGNSATTTLGDSADRRQSANPNGFNFRPNILSSMDLSTLSAPTWTTTEGGSSSDWPSEGNNSWYTFGCLAVGNNDLVVAIALADTKHRTADYTDMTNTEVTWIGGNAFLLSSDGGTTWRTRTGTLASDVDWTVALPTADCTIIPKHFANLVDQAFTLGQFCQFGKGYADNTDGYVYFYAPSGLENDRDNPSTHFKQRRSVVGRCSIGTSHNNLSAIFTPSNWTFYDGAAWDADPANAAYVMEWPGPGAGGGQAWIPSIIYLKSQDIYLAISAEKDMATYPTVHPGVHIMSAPAPEGPWTAVQSFTDIDLRGDNEDRLFEPFWIPGQCDIDAGVDGSGNVLVDCYYGHSGLGNAGWTVVAEVARYGLNIGKMRFAFSTSQPTPGALPVLANHSFSSQSPVASTITGLIPTQAQAGDLLLAMATGTRNGTRALPSTQTWTLASSGEQAGSYAGTATWYDIAWRVAQIGDAGSVVTWNTPGGVGALRILRITGADTTAPIDNAVVETTGQSTTPTLPQVTTLADKRLILHLLSLGATDGDGSEFTGTIPASSTAIGNWEGVADGDASDWHSNVAEERDQVTAGLSASGTWTTGGTTPRYYIAATVAIRPAAGGVTKAASRVETSVEGLKTAAVAAMPFGRVVLMKVEMTAGQIETDIQLGEAGKPVAVTATWASGTPVATSGPIIIGQGLDDTGAVLGSAGLEIAEIIVVDGTVSAGDETSITTWLQQHQQSGGGWADGTRWEDGTGWVD